MSDVEKELAQVLRQQFRIGPIQKNSRELLLAGSSHLSLTGSEADELSRLAVATLERLGYRQVELVGYQDQSNGGLHTAYFVEVAERARAIEEDDLEVYEAWRSGMDPVYREAKTGE